MLYCCTPFLEAMKFDLKFSNALLRSMNQGYEVRQNENVESDESDEFADFMHSSKSSQDQIERNKNTAHSISIPKRHTSVPPMVAVPSYASLNVHLGHGSKFIRHVFARRHREASHDKNDSSSSTLFVANVPAGATCEVCDFCVK